jgi:hypothetical protein
MSELDPSHTKELFHHAASLPPGERAGFSPWHAARTRHCFFGSNACWPPIRP